MQVQHRGAQPRVASSSRNAAATGLTRPVHSKRSVRPFVACQAAHGNQATDVDRRQMLLSAGAALMAVPLSQLLPARMAQAAEQGFKELSDPILAYSFIYPTQSSTARPLDMIMSRAPEKYSSAAPLAADARQRIVSELIDPRNFVTVSVTVGPAAGLLKDKQPSEWKPRDVAFQVLADRSTSRLSTGQRTSLNDIEDVRVVKKDGSTYVLYEHLSQGSPTVVNPGRETYRHALAITSWRPGTDGTQYLYTLNVSTRQDFWDDLEPQFRQAIDSFKLLETTSAYIPPDQNPWLFF